MVKTNTSRVKHGNADRGTGRRVTIVGGGLAGSEAAWQLLQSGVPVRLYEMRPTVATAAHQTETLAELVCSNSFRSDDASNNAVGLLHEEMRRLDSLIMAAGDAHKIPAGGALAVDRHGFSSAVEARLLACDHFELRRSPVEALPVDDPGLWIIATGPLTHGGLAESIRNVAGIDHLAFFDAIAPIVHKDSVNMDVAWFQSRYDKPGPGGTGADYLNCPLDQATYQRFIEELLAADKTAFRDWEKDTPYFEGCLPIEVMAARGHETLRFGPMKPVGLTDPQRGERPHAVVQLRQDNALGTLFNMVGFQTKLKHGEQVRILRMIPGLEDAQFARLGGLHRNTFIKSPELLDSQLRLRSAPNIRFAGQITGVEGYVESAALGLIAGRLTAAQWHGFPLDAPSAVTAHGALINHIAGGALAPSFQPMNVNFGLFAPLAHKVHKNERKQAVAGRALKAIDAWQDGFSQTLHLACQSTEIV